MGRPLEINCTLYTPGVVNSSDVNISWIGPDGVITNDERITTVIPSISNSYSHTSTLQFSYLSEKDEDTSYNCTSYLLGEYQSKSFTISNLSSKLGYCHV